MEQSKYNTSSDLKPVVLITESIAEIDGCKHKFGYYSDDGKFFTMQKITQNLDRGLEYIRKIEAIECRFIIRTKDKFSISRESLNLDEFCQLVALGIDSNLIASYIINDPRLPKSEPILSLYNRVLFNPDPTNPDSPIIPIELLSVSRTANLSEGYSDEWTFEGRSSWI